MIDDHETYGPFGIHVVRDDRVPRDELWLVDPARLLVPPSAAVRREMDEWDRQFRATMQYGTVAGLNRSGELTLAERLILTRTEQRHLRMRRRVTARRQLNPAPVGARPENHAAHTAGRVCRTTDDGRLRNPGGQRWLAMLLDAQAKIRALTMRPTDVIKIDPV